MQSLRGPDEKQPSASRQRESSAGLRRAQDIVNDINARFQTIEEIPERLRGRYFSAVDTLREEGDSGDMAPEAGAPSDAAGRARVAQMRRDAGMPENVAEGGAPSGVATIKTERDYLNLAPGAEFIGPDGQRRRKPK